MSQKKRINIAIDGYASTGKSTTARAIAQKLGYIYVDTGAMYRAVTWYALENGLIGPGFFHRKKLINALETLDIDFRYNPKTGTSETFLNGKNVEAFIRRPQVAEYVSEIAAVPEVRKKLVEIQQKMAQDKGVVMDGRDIGSVVMPEAELKIFMTASPQVRAQRRYAELRAKGENVRLDEILRNVEERDRIDTTRSVSPLRMTPDARLLDNTKMSIPEQINTILKWVEEILKNKQ